MPGIGLIINVRSHGNQQDPSRPRRLARLIGSRGDVAVTHSLDDLHRVCTRLEKTRPEILAICGGDGTLHQTITAMIQAYGDQPLPLIAILRGGAMNIIANSLGIGADADELLRELLVLRKGGGREGSRIEAFEHELLQVGDRYGFMFGTGVIHDFLKEYYATGRPSSATAARLLARAIASGVIGGAFAKRIYRPFRARVVADGAPWPRLRFVTVCAATIEQIGLGFRPFYRCRERPRSFAVLGIDTTCLGLVRELPRIRAGSPMRRDKVIDGVACEVTIAPIEPRELGYMIDGDLYTCEQAVTLRTGPKLGLVRLKPANGARS